MFSSKRKTSSSPRKNRAKKQRNRTFQKGNSETAAIRNNPKRLLLPSDPRTPVTYRREAAPAPREQRRRCHWRRRQRQRRRRRRERAWRQVKQQRPETTARPSHSPGTSTTPAGGGPRRESTATTAMEVAAASCCSVLRRLPLPPRLFFVKEPNELRTAEFVYWLVRERREILLLLLLEHETLWLSCNWACNKATSERARERQS